MPIEGDFQTPDKMPVLGVPEPGGLPPTDLSHATMSDRVRAAEDATRIEQPVEPSLKRQVEDAEAVAHSRYGEPPTPLMDRARLACEGVAIDDCPLFVSPRDGCRNGREAGAYFAGIAMIVGEVYGRLLKDQIDGAVTALVGAGCTVRSESGNGAWCTLWITCPMPSDIGADRIGGQDW